MGSLGFPPSWPSSWEEFLIWGPTVWKLGTQAASCSSSLPHFLCISAAIPELVPEPLLSVDAMPIFIVLVVPHYSEKILPGQISRAFPRTTGDHD
jgi:hypothetical protein